MKVLTVKKIKKVCPYCGHLNELRIAGTYHGEYKYSGKCIDCFNKLIWEKRKDGTGIAN